MTIGLARTTTSFSIHDPSYSPTGGRTGGVSDDPPFALQNPRSSSPDSPFILLKIWVPPKESLLHDFRLIRVGNG